MAARAHALLIFSLALLATRAAAQEQASGSASGAAMEDGRGFAVGISLDLVGLDSDSQDVFATSSPSFGVGGFVRYDLWRPAPTWAVGVIAMASHHGEGEGADPRRDLQSGQEGDETGEPMPADIAAERFTNVLAAGLELRHGLLPWLVPFLRVAGGVAFVAADFTDPNDCVRTQSFDIPQLDLPDDVMLPEVCAAYRIHHDSTSAPAVQATLGFSLRATPGTRTVLASPVALSFEAGYVVYGDTTLSVDAIDDAQLVERLDSLAPSSWLARISLHVWF